MEYFDFIINIVVSNFNIASFFDIAIVSYLIYSIYGVFKKTRGEQLLKGLIFLFLLIPVSGFLELTTINFLLSNTLGLSITVIVIVFQPEVRRGLEALGRSNIINRLSQVDRENSKDSIQNITEAVTNLASTRTGALIIIERLTGLSEILSTGIKINGIVTKELLENIFVVNSPLHDGAVIIKDDIIVGAACVLPLTYSASVNKSLGTRHRAAIGISEASDAIAIVVSEETGKISVAVKGTLSMDYTKERLNELLNMLINVEDNNTDKKGGVKKWIKNHFQKI